MVGGNINIAVPLKTKKLSDFIISLFLHNAEHARSYAYSTFKDGKCHRLIAIRHYNFYAKDMFLLTNIMSEDSTCFFQRFARVVHFISLGKQHIITQNFHVSRAAIENYVLSRI